MIRQAAARPFVLLLAIALFGCSPPPDAPSELNELIHFIYREWEHEDPRVLGGAVENLEAFILSSRLHPDDSLLDRSFSVKPLSKEDLHSIKRNEERDPALTSGVAVARASPHSVELHALLQTDDDQGPAEPSAKTYVRHFTTDRECFRNATCDVLRTENEVTRQNLAMSVDMLLYKDFRWVAMEGDRKAMIARSWTPQSYASGDNAAIHQSYSLDMVLPLSTGQTWRMQVVYSETVGIIGTEEMQRWVVNSSTDDGLKAADEVISERHAR